MIVVDSSAVLAVLLGEAGAAEMADALSRASSRTMSPVNHVETTAVLLGRRGDAAVAEYGAFVRELAVRLHPIDADTATLAADAYRVFGKGRHPAGLNLGDCFAYATAKALNAPLLYVGDDFAMTDLAAVA